jgi:filamentous hemagglutinin family protein
MGTVPTAEIWRKNKIVVNSIRLLVGAGRTGLVLALIAVMGTSLSHAGAGIATDGSVGLRQTIAGANAGTGNFSIPQSLGALSGNNLFHSFSTFNIDSGQTATFTTATSSIANVISRVTGGSASQINGTLAMKSSVGSAPAFFFINPAGVVFGNGASVSVPAAFHVSTADYIKFANGDKLYAELTRASTLSSAAPEAFGFLGTTSAAITIKDVSFPGFYSLHAISLVAGDIDIRNADVYVNGGDARVVALGQKAQEIGFAGTLPAAFGSLSISKGGYIRDVSSSENDTGSVKVSAGNISITANEQGSSKTSGISASFPKNNGSGGNVEVAATGNLIIGSYGYISSSSYYSTTTSAGTVKVSAANISIDGGQGNNGSTPTGIYTSPPTGGRGAADNIEVSTPGNLSILSGGQISASSSYGSGNAGSVKVSAGNITIDGQGRSYPPAGILATANSVKANAGNVDVSATGNLSILNGGRISSNSSYSSGNGGTVTVAANSIVIDGQENNSPSSTGIFSDISNFNALSAGNAGSVNVRATGNLSVRNASISAGTRGSGNGGDVEVAAIGDISILSAGFISSNADDFLSALYGKAGTVKVAANDIVVDAQDSSYGAAISSETNGTGNAGSVSVTSRGNLSVLNGGRISSDTFGQGDAGDVKVSATGRLSLNNGSISSGALSSGKGGTVDVSAGSINIENGSISADASGYIFTQGGSTTGNAGDVNVTTTGNLSILSAGQISSNTYGSGDAGSVKVSAANISIDGQGKGLNWGTGQITRTGIFSESGEVEGRPVGGNAGHIEVAATGNISILNDGVISTTTNSTSGNAGNVKVNAASITIDGKIGSNFTGIFSDANWGTGNAGSLEIATAGNLTILNGGIISSSTFSSGRAGNVAVEAGGSLSIANGGVIASDTAGPGAAGSVSVRAGSLLVDGAMNEFPSAISAVALEGSSGQTGSVSVTADNITLSNGGQISISNEAKVPHPEALKPTLLTVVAPSIIINGGMITAETRGNVTAGNVEVTIAGAVNILNGGLITSDTYSSGNAGSVKVTAGSIAIKGQECCTTGISSDAIDGSMGHAGNVEIVTTGNLSIAQGGFISSDTWSLGNAGSVKVNAGSITIDGKEFSKATGILTNANSSSRGHAGSVEIVTSERISIVNGGEISSNTFSSGNAGTVNVSADSLAIDGQGNGSATGILSNANPGSTGNAGIVEVVVKGKLSVDNGGEISSSTGSSGNAGSVKVSTGSIAIDGHGNSNATGIFSSTSSGSAGNAGSVDVLAAGVIFIDNGGEISTSTYSSGAAGTVKVSAGTLRVDGDLGKISAAASEGSSGQTGSIEIVAGGITLSNGGQISIENNATVDKPTSLTPTAISVTAPSITILNSPNAITTKSTGNVAAGNITITASDKLFLDPSGITTTSNQGNGGAIDITAGTLWLDNSQIATSVTGLTGNGGDISIAATSLVMNTGFIQANTAAANASGGLVSITAQNLIPSGNTLFLGGSTPHVFLPGTFGYNVIQAAAPTGVSGVVQISSPTLDVSASLVGLNTRMMKNDQMARHPCENVGGSSLSSVGRGGLPLTGSDFLSPGQLYGQGFIASVPPVASSRSMRIAALTPCRASI